MSERDSLTAQLQHALMQSLSGSALHVTCPDEAPGASLGSEATLPSGQSSVGSKNVEGGTPLLDSAISEQQKQVSILADLEYMLLDESDQDEMQLSDMIAYHELHTELACIIGEEVAHSDLPESWQEVLKDHERDARVNELKKLLLECAKAELEDDFHTATLLVSNIRRYSTPYGSALQRLTHYLVEALVARLHGTGAHLYSALRGDRPYGFHTQRSYEVSSKVPIYSMAYQFTNSVLLDAFEGAERVHIVSYGILNGRQWPNFMRVIACRSGGPPRLRMTGIELPEPGLDPDEKLMATGARLKKFATSLGIPFEFQGISQKWEDVQVCDIGLREDEVLAVCSVYRLRHMLDDNVMPTNPRKIVLQRICSMNPTVFVTVVVSMAVNMHSLLDRIPDLVDYMSHLFDLYENTLADYPEERLYLEQEIPGRGILNILACEGLDRRERAVTHGEWEHLLVNAGFQQVALQENWFNGVLAMLEDYHKDFSVRQERGWLLQCWKQRALHAMAAWRCAHPSEHAGWKLLDKPDVMDKVVASCSYFYEADPQRVASLQLLGPMKAKRNASNKPSTDRDAGDSSIAFPHAAQELARSGEETRMLLDCARGVVAGDIPNGTWEESVEDQDAEVQLSHVIAHQAQRSELAHIVHKVAVRLNVSGSGSRTPLSSRVLVPEHATEHVATNLQVDASELPDGTPQKDLSVSEVTDALLECARAVLAADVPNATMLVNRIRLLASQNGSALQRMTHYCAEGLVAKLHGTGADLYSASFKNRPDGYHTQRAQKVLSLSPMYLMAYQFTNAVLLDAFEGADRVHVISYGILNGRQWLSFMEALANRSGGPPQLRLTGIEYPQPGLVPDERLVEIGRRLKRFAERLGICFDFQSIAGKWEDVQVHTMGLRKDEALAVCTLYRLRHLMDDSVLPSNPRRIVLEKICSMNSVVFVTGFMNAALNSPFLVTRIPALVGWMSCVYEIYESTLSNHPEERQYLESEISGRSILNILACEGLDRKERSTSYYQWHRLLVNAGFQQLPLQQNWFKSTAEKLQGFNNNFTIGRDGGWLLQGWKDKAVWALAAWAPARSGKGKQKPKRRT